MSFGQEPRDAGGPPTCCSAALTASRWKVAIAMTGTGTAFGLVHNTACAAPWAERPGGHPYHPTRRPGARLLSRGHRGPWEQGAPSGSQRHGHGKVCLRKPDFLTKLTSVLPTPPPRPAACPAAPVSQTNISLETVLLVTLWADCKAFIPREALAVTMEAGHFHTPLCAGSYGKLWFCFTFSWRLNDTKQSLLRLDFQVKTFSALSFCNSMCNGYKFGCFML